MNGNGKGNGLDMATEPTPEERLERMGARLSGAESGGCCSTTSESPGGCCSNK